MTKSHAYLLVLSAAFFYGCSTTTKLTDQDSPDPSPETDYTLIFYIHGDSDYLFHEKDGSRAEADQQALMKAIDVAEQAGSGEVFIYHKKPAKRFLWMIPRRSSNLHHYRNGEKVQTVRYRISSDEPFLKAESDMFHHLHTDQSVSDRKLYFFYFGHEIPTNSIRGYHQSRADVAVDIETFSNGTASFLNDEESRFGLMVLSTCSNGSPAMVNSLSGTTDYLLASPQNLHLSHMDFSSLALLEGDSGLTDQDLAGKIADETFERLSASVQTAVTLSVYDMDIVTDYISQLYSETREYEEAEKPDLFRDNIDCGDLSFFDSERFTPGVITYFRAPRFGRHSSASDHSGWGCKGR